MTSSRAYNMYKLMASPSTRTTRTTCSAYGCDMKSGTNKFSEIQMFTFPRNPFRRRRWELATRRANWKSHSRSRICSKHFITGRPSKDPNHPDYVPSIFTFHKNTPNSKSLNGKTRRKLTARKSCRNPACSNSSSHKETDITSSGVKGLCKKCFSSESASSAFSQSLEPLNHTLTQLMHKLADMEEEREQLRQELALCRGEIHELRKAHQDCMTRVPTTNSHSVANKSAALSSTTSDDVNEMLQSLFSDEDDEVYDTDLLPSQYLEQIHQHSDEASKIKRQTIKKKSKETISDETMSILEECQYSNFRKKSEKNSSLVSENTSKSPKDGKSSDTSSPITIIYLKP